MRGSAGAEGQNFRPLVTMETSMATNGRATRLTFEVVVWSFAAKGCSEGQWIKEGKVGVTGAERGMCLHH